MNRRPLLAAVVVSVAPFVAGCSGTGAAMTAWGIGKNLRSNQLDIRVFLDGNEAQRSELEQAARGYSHWKIKEDVSTAPKLRFEFKKPGALGRIRSITLAIHQKFEAKYSDQAEFTVASRSHDPEAQMKPGVEYDLGAPGEAFRVVDWQSKEVPGVALRPGMEYQLVLTVAADDSESAIIYFKTK